MTLRPFAIYAGTPTSQTVLIALLVALIPTTIGALLSAIGIAGMDRMVQRNVLAMSGRAVEAAGDVDVLLLDKTGTITLGNRQASEFVPVDGVTRARARGGRPALVAGRRDAGRPLDRRAREGASTACARPSSTARGDVHPLLGDDADERRRPRTASELRKGAADAIKRFVEEQGGRVPARARRRGRQDRPRGRHAARRRPGQLVLGVIHLKDIVKGGMGERFDELRKMGIRTVMITGDNRVTAAVIAGRPASTTSSPRRRPKRRWR